MGFSIPILSNLVDLGKTWIEGKQKQSQAMADAKAAVITQASQSTAEWTSLMAKASASSWKDEYWSVIFGTILIMCFVPYTQDYVGTGFQYLAENTPAWFQYILTTIVLASFGIKAGAKVSDHKIAKKALEAIKQP